MIVCFRALIIRAGEIIPMSSSFTPESERQRLQFLVREIWISHRILILVNSVYSSVVLCSAAGLGKWFSRTRMFVCILSRTKSPIMEHVLHRKTALFFLLFHSVPGSPAAVSAGKRVHALGVSQKGHEKRGWEENAVPRLHNERMVSLTIGNN